MVKIKAVLFDMDGTLLDSYDAYFLAWRDTLKEYGVNLSREKSNSMGGMSYTEMMKAFLGEKYYDLKKQNRMDAIFDCLSDKSYSFLAKNGKPKPFAKETLLSLKKGGMNIAVVSSSSRRILDLSIQLLDIQDMIDFSISDKDVVHNKPAPDCYLMAKDRYRMPTNECIVVEDSPIGIEAGKSAGMKVIGVTGSFENEKLNSASPDYVFDNLKDAGDKIINLK
ncbi:MAG: HAD family phosphatase [Candidatus Aenigmarchaeota archaeon]|nr:HAD family phosphatase [Candidatus Aenigmarchaeota archaeon]